MPWLGSPLLSVQASRSRAWGSLLDHTMAPIFPKISALGNSFSSLLSFLPSIIHLSIHLFFHSFNHSFLCSFVYHSFIDALSHSFIYNSHVPSPTRSWSLYASLCAQLSDKYEDTLLALGLLFWQWWWGFGDRHTEGHPEGSGNVSGCLNLDFLGGAFWGSCFPSSLGIRLTQSRWLPLCHGSGL